MTPRVAVLSWLPFPSAGIALACVIAALSGGCGTSQVPGTRPDAGTDAGSDAGADAGSDAGADAGSDAGADAGSDAGSGQLCANDPAPAPLGSAVVTPGAADRFLLRGRVVTPDSAFEPGEVLVSGTTIACVGASCASDPAAPGATVIDTRGVIYPGLIDAHNHTQYDYLPPWLPNPPRLYANRYQWPDDPTYKAWNATVNGFEATSVCEQVKYGEIRAMLGGATTMQGTFNTARKCFRTLVHNAEHDADMNPTARTNIPGVDSVNATSSATLNAGMLDGSITAYIIHVAEGLPNDAKSAAEFGKLVGKGLLQAPTVIIHGTAFGAPEFEQMAAVGAKLVWSPQSNLVLYGQTTDVPTALAKGVSVSLAPDWTLSGGPTLLHELKAARHVSCTQWGGLLDAKKLVQMVTTEPANALGLGSKTGRLATGLLADILVIRDRGMDPYRTLVEANLNDVRLVLIAGTPRYGDAALVAATNKPLCEPFAMCGEDKLVCVSDTAAADPDKKNESFADVVNTIKGFYPSPLPFDTCP